MAFTSVGARGTTLRSSERTKAPSAEVRGCLPPLNLAVIQHRVAWAKSVEALQTSLPKWVIKVCTKRVTQQSAAC